MVRPYPSSGTHPARRQRRKAPAPVHTHRAAARARGEYGTAGAGAIGPAARRAHMLRARRAVPNSAPGQTGVARDWPLQLYDRAA